MERIQRGWSLTRVAWSVLIQDRSLVLLPILSFLATAALVAFTLFGVFSDDIRTILNGTGSMRDQIGPMEIIVFAALSYGVSYIAIFFNVALICGADERMQGGDPTVGSALAAARSHARAIAPWAAVSLIVHSVLRAIEQRGGIFGRIVATIAGVGWAMVTYLILPVLVLEGRTVRDAFTRSKDLFKRTWGEMATGEVGMSIIAFLLSIAIVPVAFLIGAGGDAVIIGVAIGIAVAWIATIAVVFTALNALFRVALYRYATDGEAPVGYEDMDFASMFGGGLR